MSVKTDCTGHRSVVLDIDLPGTPEQVWQAIATGPGITAWFVPSEVEERDGGTIGFHFGPDMVAAATITGWDPPRRFAYEERGWNGDAPPLATEFVITPRDGGGTTVRLVHSLFADGADWDGELEGMESGWPPFFAVLRHYLARWPGQAASSIRPTGFFPGTTVEAWTAVTEALGLAGAGVGDRRRAPAGAPWLAGTVEALMTDDRHSEVLLRLDEPAPGVALVGSYSWGGRVRVAISLYVYGPDAKAVVAREAPRWDAWIAGRFAPPPEPAPAA